MLLLGWVLIVNLIYVVMVQLGNDVVMLVGDLYLLVNLNRLLWERIFLIGLMLEGALLVEVLLLILVLSGRLELLKN